MSSSGFRTGKENTLAPTSPVWQEITRKATQGEVIHNEDASMKILRFVGEASDSRTDLLTSGIVTMFFGHSIAVSLPASACG